MPDEPPVELPVEQSIERAIDEPAKPADEAERLRELRELELVEAGREAAYDDLVALVARLCEMPMAAITVIDAETEWIKARIGFDVERLPRQFSFCAHTILDPGRLLIVPDTLQDPRFATHPLVTGPTQLRFYAGAPLTGTSGAALGSLCVMDTRPRVLDAARIEALEIIARQTCALIELRHRQLELQRQRGFLRTVIDSLHEGLIIRDGEGRIALVNDRACELLGEPLQKIVGRHPRTSVIRVSRLDAAELAPDEWPDAKTLATGTDATDQLVRIARRDGTGITLELNTRALWRDGAAGKDIDGVVTSLRDVSERREMLERLRDSEARLQSITDNVPALITYVDEHERFGYCNKVVLEWLGRPASAVQGRPMREIYGEAGYASRMAHVRAALSGQRREFGLWDEQRGHRRFVRTSYVPDIDGDGRVRGFFALTSDLTEMKMLELQLAAEARIDALTGLPNRKQFELHLEQALQRANRHRKALALGFLDIDHFKQINDRHGHAVGDLVLKEFALRLHRNLRQIDFAARLSGDEFTLVLEDLEGRRELLVVAEKLLASLTAPLDLPSAKTLAISSSIGFALAEPDDDACTLLQRADAAMYEAKSAGRGCYRVAAGW